MENKKSNKKLISEIEQAQKWMNFLDNKKNYNKSFHLSEAANNPKLFKEYDENEYDGSPEEETDDLILGNDQTTEDDLISTEFFMIAKDTNGDIHVDSTDEADDKESAMDILDDNMFTDVLILDGIEIDGLMDALYELRGVKMEADDDKPPFIDIDGDSGDELIDEDCGLEECGLAELQEAERLIKTAMRKKANFTKKGK